MNYSTVQEFSLFDTIIRPIEKDYFEIPTGYFMKTFDILQINFSKNISAMRWFWRTPKLFS